MGPNGTPLYQNVSGAGRLLVAYDSQGTHYQVTDPLGTRRLQTDAEGVPEMDFQELPYGDGLTAVPDPNDMDESDDATPFHFTGKERDLETGFANGNDYFDARYYASSMGRFLSPDWSAKVMPVPYARLVDPQSLNLYAYARNNPLNRFDPDGHYTCADSAKCDSKNDQAFQARLGALAKAQQGLKSGSADYKQIGSILKAYGAAGEKGTANGKTVSVDFTNTSDGGLTSQTARDTITVNFNAKFSQQSEGNAAGMDGLVAHEGQHVVDGAPRGQARLPSEIAAERASQAAFQGLSSQGIDGMNPGSYITRGWSTLWQPTWSDPALRFVRDMNAMMEGINDYQTDMARDRQQ